jgi:type IV pilus assembly protein PilC
MLDWAGSESGTKIGMAEFLVKMADERGHLLQQVENGFSESEVRDRFVQQGYLVYWVKPKGMLAGGEISLPWRRKIKLDQFVVFNQQFLTLIKAGLPVLMSLELLIKRQQNPHFKSLLEDVKDRVKSGELLSTAFAAQGAFPRIYSTTLEAGEKSGNMEEVLGRYIAFQRLAMTFRKKLAVSLVYPTLLVVVVLFMVVFLVTYVVPEFAKLFENLNAQLPGPTLFMLAVGTVARKYFVVFLVGLVVVVLGLWRWKRTDRGADAINRVILHLPLLGQVWLKYQVANFSRMMATLLAGGLPLVPAMETASASMGSRLLQRGVEDATVSVREGQPLSRSLEEEEVLPDLAVEMIEVGESTGALPAMLTSVAEFYEEDVQTALGAALALIEPVILIIMAVFVGGVLISLYLPIFTLGSGGFR